MVNQTTTSSYKWSSIMSKNFMEDIQAKDIRAFLDGFPPQLIIEFFCQMLTV